MYKSISKNNELENEMTLDMSYFWYSEEGWKKEEMSMLLKQLPLIAGLSYNSLQAG